jgi:hypothetical protein
MKVKDLENGVIVWSKNNILGIKGCTLNKKYDEYECIKVPGNPLDYELIERS